MSTLKNTIHLSKDVAKSDDEWLTREVTIDEVWTTVQQIGPLTPGSDSMHVIFYLCHILSKMLKYNL